MRHRTFLITGGILLALLPSFGIPPSWKDTFLVVFGIILTLIALTMNNLAEVPIRKGGGGNKDETPPQESSPSTVYVTTRKKD